jgi:hypothetical protein
MTISFLDLTENGVLNVRASVGRFYRRSNIRATAAA